MLTSGNEESFGEKNEENKRVLFFKRAIFREIFTCCRNRIDDDSFEKSHYGKVLTRWPFDPTTICSVKSGILFAKFISE